MNTRQRRGTSRSHKQERGTVLVLLALSAVAVLLVLSLSIDIGTAYVQHARLSQSVDAGVLAGARNTASGDAQLTAIALKVAKANYPTGEPVNYTVTITVPAADTKRVSMSATTTAKGRFASIIGKSTLGLSVDGEATRYPLDMSLLLDLSYSLQRNNAFDDMQAASTAFLAYFDDSVDQVGIATYSTWAVDQLPVQKSFQSAGTSLINGLSAISDTNIQEGLRVSKSQLDVAPQRAGALKIVVLFTDGRPTAYRQTLSFSDPDCPTYDSIAASYINGESYRGLFRWTDGSKIRYFNANCTPITTYNGSYSTSVKPTEVSSNSPEGTYIRTQGALKAEEQATTIRQAGYTIYAVGLGNPNALYPGDVPDLDFLARVANEDGQSNMNEPRGEVFFAPSPAELDNVFAQLANRLLTRLTR